MLHASCETLSNNYYDVIPTILLMPSLANSVVSVTRCCHSYIIMYIPLCKVDGYVYMLLYSVAMVH